MRQRSSRSSTVALALTEQTADRQQAIGRWQATSRRRVTSAAAHDSAHTITTKVAIDAKAAGRVSVIRVI